MQVYLHFPFCKRKCFYCDFCSAAESAETIAAYCVALEKEILLTAEKYSGQQVDTVFLGGGTPSIVPAAFMAKVLETLVTSFDIVKHAEFTSEANPGTLREDWLSVMCKFGMNRMSLGVQSANDDLLAKIGRIHTFEEAKHAVKMIRSSGISNLNIDMMFALPTQTLQDYRQTLDAICALEPEHISAYSLILEEGTPLFDRVHKGETSLPTEDEAADMYLQGIGWLAEYGYHQYEVSNFAKSHYGCKHNIGYWQDEHYLGLGVSAHSMLPPDASQQNDGVCRIRQANTNDLHAYIAKLNEGKLPIEDMEYIKADEAMFETMMLGLRMTKGVDASRFEAIHGLTMQSAYEPELGGLIADGLALWQGNWFTLTPRGLALQNDVLMRLMKN